MPFKYELSDVIPWYGYEGCGKQARFLLNDFSDINPWKELIEKEYIKIEIIGSPNNSFEILNNNKIKFR